MKPLLLLAAMVAAYVGSAFFALAQDRHRAAIAGRGVPYSLRRAGLCGAFFSGCALLLLILRDGFSFAMLTWPLLLAFAALAVALTLTWRRAWLKPLARAIRSRHPSAD